MSLYAGGWFGFTMDPTPDAGLFATALPTNAGPEAPEARSLAAQGCYLVWPDCAADPANSVAGVYAGADGSFLMAAGHFFSPEGGEPASAVPQLLWNRWKREGDRLWETIDGSFVVAICDVPNRRLTLVCDREENHSLYFRTGERGCLFATELPAILATLREQPPLNPDFLIDSLLTTWHLSDLAPMEGVRRVPPGHLAEITAQGIRYRRHWFPERFEPVRFARDDDYVDAALEQLERAVLRRLPRTGPVAAHCSSGLDSTLVTAVAARLLAAQGRELIPVTMVTPPSLLWADGTNAHWDEGPAVREFLRLLPNARPVEVSLDQPGLYEEIDRFQRAAGRPALGVVHLKPHNLMHAAAAAGGARVIFTGIGGNVTLSAGNEHTLLSLLRGARPNSFLAGWRGLRSSGLSHAALAYHTFGALIPEGAMSALLRLSGRRTGWSPESVGLRPGIEEARPGAFENWRRLVRGARTDSGTQRRRATLLAIGGWQVVTQAARRQNGLHMRHPLADAALARFSLGLPPDQLLYRGETRSIARRLARRLGLPRSISENTHRAWRTSAWPRLLREADAEIGRDLDRMAVDPLAVEVLDVPRLRAIFQDMRQDGRSWREGPSSGPSRLFPALSVARYIFCMRREEAAKWEQFQKQAAKAATSRRD